MPVIVLVEDNRTVCENTAEFLELEGYTVIMAYNGKTGFQKIIELHPDLVICDILMPEMSGFELLSKMGLHSELNSIPLIFFSAKAEKGDMKKGMDMGAYDYIVKPSDLSDLLASIQKCLKEKKVSKVSN